jgi:C-terminal processing protease CtpA/Prc
VKLTIRKFYRASGSSTQLKGVTPDIVLPSVNNYAEVANPRWKIHSVGPQKRGFDKLSLINRSA